MSTYELGDENHPPFGFGMSQKPRPVGVYSKSTQDNVDLKAIISSPYGLNMGKLGLGIAEGMALRRPNSSIPLEIPPFPRNLVLNNYQPLLLTPKDNLTGAPMKRADMSVRAGRRHAVLRKPITKSRNTSPTRLPTRSKVAQKVGGNRTRNSCTSDLLHPTVRKRAMKQAGTVYSDSGMFCQSYASMPYSSSTPQSLCCGSNLLDIDTASTYVPPLPTIVMIHPSDEQYESLLKSAPSHEVLARSHPSLEFMRPSFGSVKQRAKELDKSLFDVSAPSLLVSGSAVPALGTKSDIPVDSKPNLESRTGSYHHSLKFGASSTKPSFQNRLSRIQGRTNNQSLSETLSTIAVDVFGTQTDDCTSLLYSTSSLQTLTEEPSQIPPLLHDQLMTLSTRCDDSQTTSSSSVYSKLDLHTSIATSVTSPEISSRTLLACQTVDETNSVNDISISSSESHFLAAITTSTIVDFTQPPSIEGGTGRTKHERLLAAILDTVPPSPESTEKCSPPSVLISGDEEQPSMTSEPTSPTLTRTFCLQGNRNSINVGVPAIVITGSLETMEQGIPSCSSSFSIIDLYVGGPEMPCLGPQRNRTNTTARPQGLALETTCISNVNVLRNSVSFPDQSTAQWRSSVVDITSISSSLSKKRDSLLSVGMPSSFLSMSTVNEDGGGKSASGLKALFRRSMSKGSLVGNSGDGGPQLSGTTLSRRDTNGRRVSGWGFFKWMKG